MNRTAALIISRIQFNSIQVTSLITAESRYGVGGDGGGEEDGGRERRREGEKEACAL